MRRLAALLLIAVAAAHADVREDEIAECRPGEIEIWADGRDGPAARRGHEALRFEYRHAGAPAWFSDAEVFNALRRAVNEWSRCGVPAELSRGDGPVGVGAIAVVWDQAGSGRNFGLADVGGRVLSLGPGAFALLRNRNPRYPAGQILQMTISHELGHFYGLMAHSRRCVDVMSYYRDGHGDRCSIRDGGSLPRGVEYRALLPTACDIARCRMANGMAKDAANGIRR